MLAHDVKNRLTSDEILNHPWLNKFTYLTKNGLVVPIDDRNQVNSSFGKFHSKYEISSPEDEGNDCIEFFGENINNGCKVVIRRKQFEDSEQFEKCLIDGMPGETFAQQKSERLFRETSPYRVQKVLDWYV